MNPSTVTDSSDAAGAVLRPVVKVCAISSAEEGRVAVAAGAQALGLVPAMPGRPGVISEGLIAEILDRVRKSTQTFLLTRQQTAADITRQHRRCPSTTLQLVDRLPFKELEQLRLTLPRVALVQVVRVVDDASLDEAVAVAPLVDAILLDLGNTKPAGKPGAGRSHDWTLSRRVRDAVAALGKPVYLSGGLSAGNVAAAIAAVQPFGLDLGGSVRTAGRLDAVKLAAFFAVLPAV